MSLCVNRNPQAIKQRKTTEANSETFAIPFGKHTQFSNINDTYSHDRPSRNRSPALIRLTTNWPRFTNRRLTGLYSSYLQSISRGNPMAELETTDSKARILIADDSRVVRATANKILGKHFDIVIAEDGLQAWDLLESDRTILVLVTDLGMPNMDGYELIQKVRHSEMDDLRDLPIMVITGNAEDESVKKRVFELGATDFVIKPFAGAELIARLKAHASYRRDRSTLQQSSDIDLVTGVINRKALNEKLEKDVSFVTRHKQNLVIILFQLDNLIGISEKAGQEAADIVLKKTAKLLSSAIRREDSFGRFGDSTFMAILPMAKIDGVVMLVKRLCEHLKACTFKHGNDSFQLTLSAGVASLPKSCHSDAQTLIETAEQALNNACALGLGEVQMLKLEDNHADEIDEEVSIDDLLDILSSNKRSLTDSELASAQKQLAPLLALFGN